MADAALAARRRELDVEDLRFENARLKASIAERQEEIEALSRRLGVLQEQVDRSNPIRTAATALRRLGGLRLLLRRR